MPALAKMSKSELKEAIAALGEQPPTSWNPTGLRVRLAELEEAQGINCSKGKTMTDHQTWVVKLNKESKKKDQLYHFCTNELRMVVSPNATMAEMKKDAMDKIYHISVATAEDPLGFGQHSSKTYQEVVTLHEPYARWAIKTMEEGNCCHRLARFATWAQTALEKPRSSTGQPAATSMGYPTAAIKTEPGLLETQQMMMKVIEAVTALKNDVEELKEERPRKKKESEESYSMVSEPTP